MYVCYYRVSAEQQGRSGLGLEAQKASARAYLERVGGECLEDFEETRSGRDPNRPEFAKAVRLCKATGARLLVAKLDRLARERSMFDRLMKEGVRWLAADMPEANEMTVALLIIIAEHEARLISERTKAALGAKRARGERLGNPKLKPGTAHGAAIALAQRRANLAERYRTIAPYIVEAREHGAVTLQDIADHLTARRIETPSRKAKWTKTLVSQALRRISPATDART
jgi:DNA invertase Pin-like site-specific DNA recombinase